MPAGGAVRLRLDVRYDGTAFSGWAAQPGRRTVQAEVEAALATALHLERVAVVCAGRTDAGVHARGQVCHVDVDAAALESLASRSGRSAPVALRARLAGLLPADVRVPAVAAAPGGFDARFAASWRRYVYRVCDDPPTLDPLVRHQVLCWPRRLDVAAMSVCCPALLGEHDFAAFCRRRAGGTTVRTLLEYRWERRAGLVVATVRADAFCHHLVRALVGAALAVGAGRRDAGWPARVLAAGVPDPAVTVVPALGLTLEEVGYPPDGQLAARVRAARRRRDAPVGPGEPRPGGAAAGGGMTGGAIADRAVDG